MSQRKKTCPRRWLSNSTPGLPAAGLRSVSNSPLRPKLLQPKPRASLLKNGAANRNQLEAGCKSEMGREADRKAGRSIPQGGQKVSNKYIIGPRMCPPKWV